MTGARLPEGADAVVPVEWTDGGTETVAIRQQPQAAACGPPPRRRRGRGRGPAPPGHPGRPGAAGPAGRVRPGRGAGPHAAPGRGHLDRQRAGRARHSADPRPDLGVQQLHAGRGRPAGRRDRPAAPAPRRPGRGAQHPGRPAQRRRPADHQRRGEHGRRARRGQGRPVQAGHDHVPQGRHAARDAAGLRHARPGPDPDLHPARQPGQRVRVVRPVRAARARCPEKLFSATKTARCRRPSP